MAKLPGRLSLMEAVVFEGIRSPTEILSELDPDAPLPR
jgi:hypothetical protein